MEDTGQKRVNAALRQDLHKRLKIHCVIDDKSLWEVLNKIVEEYLDKYGTK